MSVRLEYMRRDGRGLLVGVQVPAGRRPERYEEYPVEFIAQLMGLSAGTLILVI